MSSASGPKTDATPRAGDIIAGKYRVEQLLGTGGMGVVVAARHVTLGQRVALKFLTADALRLPDASARFLREAQAAVGITSEHVARVFDLGTLESGAAYLAMELLAGTDLADLVRTRGPIPVELAVEYVLQACEALAEAHAQGIVHRDLKPSNLFLASRADGSPLIKVIDFGISKVRYGDGSMQESLTATDAVFGTPAYMSPEQLRSARDTDARTDVWAIGVILYELAAGRLPFEGDSMPGLCAKILVDPPVPLSSRVRGLPPGFEAVVMRTLEKNVARRVQSCGELADALAPFAPARARVSIERVVAIARRGVMSATTVQAAPSIEGARSIGSLGAVASTGFSSKPRRGLLLGAATVLGAATALAVVVVAKNLVAPRAAPAAASTQALANPEPSAATDAGTPPATASATAAATATAPNVEAVATAAPVDAAPVATATASPKPPRATRPAAGKTPLPVNPAPAPANPCPGCGKY